MQLFKGSKLRLFLATVATAGLLIAACGGNDNKTATTKDTGGDANAAPADQQVLRLRIGGEPKTIDPHLTNFSTETTLTKPLFSGLFTYDEKLQVIPNVAAEMPTVENGGVSKDALTYTIKVRKDAKWSDGKALTAKDFVYSMKRAMDPKLAGPYTSFYFAIKGAEEYNTALGTKDAPKNPSDADLAKLRDAIGVTAKDDYTVVYALKAPSPSFLSILSLWTAFPVRQDVVEKYGDKWTEAGNHIGNGAFVLKEWSHNERIVLEPNPNWHNGRAKLSRITIAMIVDVTASYAAYLNNELDMTDVPPANRREVASPTSPLNKELVKKNELTTFALMMNNKIPPFDNVKVRKAFATAFDRKAFVEAALQGVGQPATAWLPPGMPGFNGEIGKQYEFNATKAKQLLSEAGFPNGQGMAKVTFLAVSNDTNRNVIAPFVIDNFKKNLGVEVEYEFVDSATQTSRYTKNLHQVTINGWGADWPYPDNWLPELLGTGGSNNHTSYSSAKFDSLVKQAAAEPDEKKRLAFYDEAQKVAIDEDAGLAPIYNREVFILVKPKVKDLILTALDGGIRGDYNFHRTYIAKSN